MFNLGLQAVDGCNIDDPSSIARGSSEEETPVRTKMALPRASLLIRSTVVVVALGVFHCMQQEIRAFLELGVPGSIVNLSSDAGTIGTVGCAGYVASKHAVNGLTKTAALEYARRGIRVNAVAPGNIDTPMLSHLGLSTDELAHATQPSGKMGKSIDVAELVCFLLSERAEFMTGSILAIDGGTTIAGYSNGDASGAFMG